MASFSAIHRKTGGSILAGAPGTTLISSHEQTLAIGKSRLMTTLSGDEHSISG